MIGSVFLTCSCIWAPDAFIAAFLLFDDVSYRQEYDADQRQRPDYRRHIHGPASFLSVLIIRYFV